MPQAGSESSGRSIFDIYGEWDITKEELDAALGARTPPRPATMLHEAAIALGLDAASHLLDIGARDARHSIRLVQASGCRALAVDPMPNQIDSAIHAIADAGLADRIEAVVGRIEAIPADDDAFDLVWCRDMLVHVADVGTALAECRRVLRPGGAMLVYQTFATPHLEPREAQRIFTGLAIVPDRMDPQAFEAAVARAGLVVERLEVVGSEWRETWEEDATGTTSKQLLTSARLLREPGRLQAEIGAVAYEIELANALWGIYEMIGKLEPRVYVLRRP